MKKQLLLILFFTFQILVSQEVKQPKVGLVLSGGGAKGFAHLGVLKELEKSGVQIDYIGGTSMGAIVGSLYTIGYDVNQIEQIITKIDFNNLLQDKVERRNKPYFEKAYREKNAISLPIKKGKLGLPLGLSKGQNILNLFIELLAPVENITDFSKLPIPFFCIATDIETGKEVILEKGSLPLAIRASGSFPSLLTPVEINKKWLIDGGVVNNFPVDKMQQKNMDIIIGVNVQGELYKREEMTSATSILQQIVNFQMYKKSDSQIRNTNVYIRPNIIDYNVISFDKGNEIIEEGTTSVKPFKRIFDSIAKLQTIKKKRLKIIKKDECFLIDRIVIKGNRNYTKSYILGKLQLKKGDSVSRKVISKKINSLTATKNFKQIEYRLDKSFKGKKITFKVIEEDSFSSLGVGLHYDILYNSGLLVNYNHKKLLLQNDELSFNLVIGDKIRYRLDYLVDNGLFLSYGLSSRYQSFSSDIIFNSNDINKININYSDFTSRIYAQTTLDKKFAFGFGLEHKNLSVSSKTIMTENKKPIYFEKSNYLNSFAFLHLDTFDKESFPKNGFYADIEFTWYMWSNRNDKISKLAEGSNLFTQFSQVSGKFSFANTFWDKLTFQISPEFGLTLGEEESEIFDYRLGGYNKNYINNFRRLYGYDIAELSNQSFLKSEFNIRYQIFNKNYINFIANYARVNNNFLKGLELFKDLKSGYAVGYGLETFLGPIELKYSWSPDHKEKYWLFNLGFWF